jgi:hypothetical protein
MIRIALILSTLALVFGVGTAGARSETIAIDPYPTVGQTSIVSGCGYDETGELRVYLVWNTDGKHNWNNGGSFFIQNNAGCFSFEWTPYEAGLYEILVTQRGPSGKRQPQVKWVGTVA